LAAVVAEYEAAARELMLPFETVVARVMWQLVVESSAANSAKSSMYLIGRLFDRFGGTFFLGGKVKRLSSKSIT
jgi:hypothetical protein